MHHIAQIPAVLVKKVTAVKEDATTAIHGSSRGKGHVWLILLAVLVAALGSLLALAQWGSAARADEQVGRGHRITLERSDAPAFQPKLSGAATSTTTTAADGTAADIHKQNRANPVQCSRQARHLGWGLQHES